MRQRGYGAQFFGLVVLAIWSATVDQYDPVAIGIVNMSTAFDLLRHLINDDFLVSPKDSSLFGLTNRLEMDDWPEI